MVQNALEIQIRELKDMLAQANHLLSLQIKMNETLQESLKEKDEKLSVLTEQVAYLTKKLFGSSSEKHKEESPLQVSLFDDLEDVPVATVESETVVVKEHARKPKTLREDQIKGLPVEKVIVDLPEDEKTCPVCGTQMELIGTEFVRKELVFIPAKVRVREYYSQSYGCPQCKEGITDTEVPTIIKSKPPVPLMKHSLASESTVSWAMYQKFANAIPCYRQEKDWIQYGIKLSRNTLANWIIYCSSHYLEPLYEYFHRKMLQRNYLMADETRIQVLKEDGRAATTQSFMWLYRTGEDKLPPIILYEYTETRSGENVARFLKGFRGYLETDGYQGYNLVPDIKRCVCWAHIRRYWLEAIPKGKEYDYTHPAVQGFQFCEKLFSLEKRIDAHHYRSENRKKYRLKWEKPVLEAFWSWLERQRPVKGSRLDKAVIYTRNQKTYAETYLEDGSCSFSNNASENCIRPFTCGRKNWLFSDSPDGARASAVIYSIVEMSKAYQLNIQGYLEYLLKKRPSSEMSDEELDQLAPWSPEVNRLLKIENAE